MLRRCFVSLVHRRSGHNLVSRYSTHLDIQNMSREIIKPPIELLPAHRTISPTSHHISQRFVDRTTDAHTPLIPCDPPTPQARWRSLVAPSAS
jgi:hypothetical protein